MKHRTSAISVALILMVIIVGIFLTPSIGTAWDEPDNMFSAGVYVNFFTHGFDPSYFTLRTKNASAFGDLIVPNDNNPAHLPPVHNYIGLLFILGARILNIPVTAQVIIIAFHWATVVFFALMVAMTYRFGLLLGLSSGSSLFAALAVFLYPQLFGHGISNIKDTAQTAMVITSLFYLVRAAKDAVIKKKDLFIGSVMFGLGLATKFNVVYVPIIWGIWYFVTARKHIVFTAKYVLFIGIVGLATMFVVWPYLWYDTVPHIVEVVKYFTTVGQGYRVMWDGTWYNAGAGTSLWWYPLLSFFYTTPLLLLACMFFGIVVLVRGRTKHGTWVLLPIWILVPLLRTVSSRSAFYDLTRHFMETLPATLLVAAIGLEWFFQKKQHLRATGITLGAIILGQMIYINAVFFPFSTGYYNILARSPNTNFDRDIEALSVKEAVEFIHQKYGNVRVFFSIGGHQSWYYLTPADRYVYTPQDADIVVLVNKASHFRISDATRTLAGYTMVHEIRRDNAIFAWIFRKN
jgi:hypothetical protein